MRAKVSTFGPTDYRLKIDELLRGLGETSFDEDNGTFSVGRVNRVFAFTWVALKTTPVVSERSPNVWQIIERGSATPTSLIWLKVKRGRTYITRMEAFVSGD